METKTTESITVVSRYQNGFLQYCIESLLDLLLLHFENKIKQTMHMVSMASVLPIRIEWFSDMMSDHFKTGSDI